MQTNKFSLTNMFVGTMVAVVAFGAMALPAKAVTVEELQAQIAALMAQIQQLSGGSSVVTSAPAVTYAHSATLRVGARGPQVVSLQNALNAAGFSVGSADGAFGQMTATAVRNFQMAKGLTADAIVGPATAAALNAHLAAMTATVVQPPVTQPTTPTTPSTPTLNGVGIIDIDLTNLDVESVVRESTTEKVFGMEVRAEDGDIQITNLRVALENVQTGNRRPDRYLSEVSVWMENTKLASINPANMSRSGNVYSANVSLNNAIVREGVNNRKNFYIGFTALSNIDSADITNAEFEVRVNNVRYVDGTGMVMVDGFDDTVGPITFEDSTTSGEIRLRQILGSNTPEEQSIQVNEFSSTSNVELLHFSLRPEAVDMEINEIWVALNAANLGAGNTIADLINDVRLMQGNTTVASISSGFAVALAGGATGVKFELPSQFKIEEGDTENFRVVVRLKQQDGNFDNGSTLRASLNAVAAEDMDGNAISNFTGSAAGFTQTFFVEGATISFVSQNISNQVQGTSTRDFTLVFDVTAIGADVVVDRTDFATNAGVQFSIIGGGVVTPASASLTSNAQLNGDDFTVFEGQTRRFTLTVTVDATVTGQKRVKLDSVAGIAPASIIETVSATVNM
jgi:peptidoglycan hydrolase-like protein with peptidoglycan-binding domain